MDNQEKIAEELLYALFNNTSLFLAFTDGGLPVAQELLSMAREGIIQINRDDRYALNQAVIHKDLTYASNVVIKLVGPIEQWETGGPLHNRFMEKVAPNLIGATQSY